MDSARTRPAHPTRGRPGPRRLPLAVAVLAALALVVTGCSTAAPAPGNSAAPASSTPAQPSEAFPRDVDVYGKTVHLDARPTRIVILGPSLTEIVFGIGAGEQVKAVDKLSDFPADAPRSNLDAFAPSPEAVAAQKPDLVLVTNDQNKIVAGLTALKIPVALLGAPPDVQGALEQYRLVGQLTGDTAAAEKLAISVKSKITDAEASVKQSSTKLKYYWELDPALYSVTSKTFIGSVVGGFGLANIADKAPKAASSGGYPQLSAEYIINADPDLIFAADGQTPAQVKKRAGWDVTRAVKDAAGVVVIDPSISSRWGPRIADLASAIAAAVQKVQ